MLGLEPISLVFKKGRCRRCAHLEPKADTDWIKGCTTMEVEETKPRDVRGRHAGMVSKRIFGLSRVGGSTVLAKMEKKIKGTFG